MSKPEAQNPDIAATPKPEAAAAPTPQAKPSATSKTEQTKSKYRSMSEGIDVTLKSLGTKLAELLKKRKDKKEEKERAQGFTEGGASVEVSEEDKELAAEIAFIEAQTKACEIQKELNEIFDAALEAGQLQPQEDGGQPDDDGKGGGLFSCKSKEDAKKLAETIAAKYQALGLKCDIDQLENGDIKVSIHMPKGFEGRNPLTLNPEELVAVAAAAAKENQAGVSVAAASGQASEPASAAIAQGNPSTSVEPTSVATLAPASLGKGGGAVAAG